MQDTVKPLFFFGGGMCPLNSINPPTTIIYINMCVYIIDNFLGFHLTEDGNGSVLYGLNLICLKQHYPTPMS